MAKYIVFDPQIMGGEPVIVGTRIPITCILVLLKEGYTLAAIQREYPQVTIQTLAGVLEDLSELVKTPEDGWHGYDPEKVVAALRQSAGAWADIDTTAMRNLLSVARKRGSRPPTNL